MFERFTDSARRVVMHAQEEARRLDHDHIGTEHLLLGVLRDADAPLAARVLTPAGAGLEAVRRAVEEITGTGRRTPGSDVPFTTRAKKTLELSLREALQLGHDYIDAEHLLLGVLREGGGTGVRALESVGADTTALRVGVVELLRSRETEPLSERPRTPYASVAGGGLAAVESRLAAIEDRLARIERLLGDASPGNDPA